MPKPLNVAQKLIQAHLISGEMEPDGEIGLKIDQTLTQDATGTLVMLELEAMGLERVRTEVSVQYIDHNILQPIIRIPTTITSFSPPAAALVSGSVGPAMGSATPCT